MNGTPRSDVISIRRSAIIAAWASLSITHGPAITNSGAPSPKPTLPMENLEEEFNKSPASLLIVRQRIRVQRDFQRGIRSSVSNCPFDCKISPCSEPFLRMQHLHTPSFSPAEYT